MTKDYYRVLGVARDADAGSIKKAFRKLARETHPDANPTDPGAEARFREIAEAYEVLSDPARRRAYDRGEQVDISGMFGNLDDLLRSVFGGSGFFDSSSSGRDSRGQDILVRIGLSLEEAAFGADTTVEYEAETVCSTCGGEGSSPGSQAITCLSCGGGGMVRSTRSGFFGSMVTTSTCPRCRGRGRVISDPCRRCRGSGTYPELRTLRVEIPAGVSDETRLRLRGRGGAGPPGGVAGDLYVEVRVRTDPRFEREGDHLVHRITIGLTEATLGAEVEIPLLEGGFHTLRIPPGTQPGWVSRLAGRGTPRPGGRRRGALLVQVEVEVPKGVSRQEEELLRKLADLRGESPLPSSFRRPKRRGSAKRR